MKEEPFYNPLFTEDLDDVLARALKGDAIAAKEVLPIIVSILNPIPPYQGGEVMEVPDCVRAYLSLVISKIVCGTDANEAFGLKKSHRKNEYDVSNLKNAAFVMHQLLEQPSPTGKALTRKDAAESAAEVFNKNAEAQALELEKEGYWPKMPMRTVSARAVLDYYRYNESQMKEIESWLRDNAPEELPPALRAKKHRVR